MISFLDNGEIDIDSIPLDDELTYKELCAGNAVGVFQLESPGMREMMLSVQPNCIEDIMALISLYRPGPLGSKMDKMYINRKHGREPVAYAHPALEEVLKSSYGIMLYQEDVLSVARHLAGFTVGEADDLRKAIGKKLMDKIGAYREKFVEGCTNTFNVAPNISNKIYSDIEFFGGYGFNRAHAASYAMVSYITAYLKTHYPAEYMAALLSSIMGSTNDKPRMPLYLNEAKRVGLTVLPPSINESDSDFLVVGDDKVRFGLSAVSGIGPSIVDYIVRSRAEAAPSIYGFMRNTHPEVLNKATIEHLIRSGAMDGLVPEEAPDLNFNQEQIMEILSFERREIGVYLTRHPLDGVAYALEALATHKIIDLETCYDGETVILGGLFTRVNEKQTKRGDTMYELDLEDMSGNIEVLVFPREAAKNKGQFVEGDIVLLHGRVGIETGRDGDEERIRVKVFFTALEIPDLPKDALGRPIVIEFSDSPSYDVISRMNQVIQDHPGDSPVFLEFPDGPHKMSFRFLSSVNLAAEETLQTLGELLNECL